MAHSGPSNQRPPGTADLARLRSGWAVLSGARWWHAAVGRTDRLAIRVDARPVTGDFSGCLAAGEVTRRLVSGEVVGHYVSARRGSRGPGSDRGCRHAGPCTFL